MSAKVARLGGLAAVVLLAVMVALQIDADYGGPRINSTVNMIAALVVCALAAVYIARQVIDAEVRATPEAHPVDTDALAAALREHISDLPLELDAAALAAALKEHIAGVFRAELEEALNDMYRLGMVHGAERVARSRGGHLAAVLPEGE